MGNDDMDKISAFAVIRGSFRASDIDVTNEEVIQCDVSVVKILS